MFYYEYACIQLFLIRRNSNISVTFSVSCISVGISELLQEFSTFLLSQAYSILVIKSQIAEIT